MSAGASPASTSPAASAAPSTNAAVAEARLAELREQRERARQRFEAAIEERRTSQEAIKNLEVKLRVDREALDRLLGQSPAPAAAVPALSLDAAPPSPVLMAGSPGAAVAPSAIRAVPAPPPPTTLIDLLQSAAGGKLPGLPPSPSAANPGGSPLAGTPPAPAAGGAGGNVLSGAGAAYLPPTANLSASAPAGGTTMVANIASPGGNATAATVGSVPAAPPSFLGTNSPGSSPTGVPTSVAPGAGSLASPLAGSLNPPLPNALPAAVPAMATAPTAPAVLPAATPLAGAVKANSKALQEASVVAQRTVEAANQAEQEARTLTERIELLRKSIDAERRLRDASQGRADEVEAEVRTASAEMHRALVEGLDAADSIERLQVAEDRRREVRQELTRVHRHLDELHTEYAELQAEQIAALEVAEDKRDAADAALKRVEKLLNPFAPANIFQWLIDHGPRIVGVLLAIAVTIWLSRVLGRRLVRMAGSRAGTDAAEERQNRAQTLAGVVHNAINIGAVTVGVVTILDEVGVPVGPVMGGAAVLGLAVAFGAQSLIKDYFTGFMLLIEQQYLVNDVVRIGEITGQVERISLRMTVLRDLEGQAHFIPHGQITTVSNQTHSWSRAVLTIAISYRENVDRVIDELIALTREMRDDPQFGRLITEDVNMLGVDELGESSVNIKFFLKTRPLQQWPVKRELLRRIKNRFDELGIEIPFPQRTIHMRYHEPPRAALREID